MQFCKCFTYKNDKADVDERKEERERRNAMKKKKLMTKPNKI